MGLSGKDGQEYLNRSISISIDRSIGMGTCKWDRGEVFTRASFDRYVLWGFLGEGVVT